VGVEKLAVAGLVNASVAETFEESIGPGNEFERMEWGRGTPDPIGRRLHIGTPRRDTER
jgi:hypothetical protein